MDSDKLKKFEQWLDNQYRDTLKLSKIERLRKLIEIRCYSRLNSQRVYVLPNNEQDILREPIKPKVYEVTYSLPTFVNNGNGIELLRNWKGTVKIDIELSCFTEKKIPEIRMINSQIPFHHHFADSGWVCTGGIWSVAKNYGIYYYFLAIGAMLNREKEMCDYLSQNKEHLNRNAFQHWQTNKFNSISEINWAWNLK